MSLKAMYVKEFICDKKIQLKAESHQSKAHDNSRLGL